MAVAGAIAGLLRSCDPPPVFCNTWGDGLFLVFDEVDVGIGGATADVVGNLLRQLGDKGQVICVTHLAQVASKGHQHLQVSKTASKTSAESTLVTLDGDAKVEEIARMLGGAKVTEQSRAHAREILSTN